MGGEDSSEQMSERWVVIPIWAGGPTKIRITESKSYYQKLNSGHRCASALGPPSSPRRLLLGRGGTRTTSSRRCWRFRLLPNEHRLDDSRSVSTHPPHHRLPILFLSSSNYRSVFSSIAATYACSSYNLRASTGFCSRYVGGMGVWTARKDSSTNSVMNEGGGSGVNESTYKSRTTAQREARLR